MSFGSQKKEIHLKSAWMPVIESLEGRRLFSAGTIQTLPFLLDFSSDNGELLDKDSQGTGFTRVQANKLGTEYQANLIDLDTTAGVLKLTTTGTATAGSNYNQDNTQVNLLETQFDGNTSGFKMTTRLVGPLSFVNAASEQGGISFGPDQDNWVKLVAIAQGTGQYLQFADETGGATHLMSSNLYGIGSFASINTLDLQMVGDAGTGTVTAYYAINGGAFTKINTVYTVPSAKLTSFFNSAARAGIIAAQKNNLAPITLTFDSFRLDAGTPVAQRPSVTATRPANGDIEVPRDTFIAADVNLPTAGAGVDANTLDSSTVKLYRTRDKLAVAGVINTSGGGDAIVFTPSGLLDPNESYTFEVTAGVKDTSGAAFIPYTATFTTKNDGPPTNQNLAFEKVTLPTAQGNTYTCVTMGPDQKLYASTDQGLIQRFAINPDGTLGTPQNITSLTTFEDAPRLITGLAFDPTSTAANLILWVTHGESSYVNATDWTGKISKLTGANLATVQTMVTNLPRSIRDHLTNQLVFGPDGAIYFAQGAMTAMGAPDNAWGQRTEHLLSAAVLRLDPKKLSTLPLDVKTDSGGTYNPFAVGAPLTIYASGVRNAYDLVWTRDGKLYAPTNGSAAGGSTPGTPTAPYSFGPNQRIDYATKGAYTGPDVPALTDVPETQPDFLFNIVQGGFYGHPNPVRGEFVLNGGNPTSGSDTNEVLTYPVGTQPDRNYRGAAYTFGKNYSPDGAIEYKGTQYFGGSLNGTILVTEYSGGDDVVVLTRGTDGKFTVQSGIAGLSHFVDPLDIAEDTITGFLYVAEYGGQRITLVRPLTPGAHATPNKDQMVFNAVNGSGPSLPQKITITNTGTKALGFTSDGLTITGTDSARFSISQKPTLPTSINPGDSVTVSITYTANAVGTINLANLQIKTNDPDNPIILVPLRGLGTAGTGGQNEPSLQKILNLYQIPVVVGDPTPDEYQLPNPPAQPNDEVLMPVLMKEGNGPVTIEPLASFGVGSASGVPTTRFGWYVPGNPTDKNEMLTIAGNQTVNSNSQTVNPIVNGLTSFDPGTTEFGLYAVWPTLSGNQTYSEDRLNTFDSVSKRKIRFYPLKTSDGSVVPNAFVFAFEEFTSAYDNQDFVGIIRNVVAAPAGAEIGLENLEGSPFSDRLAFNRIQNPDNSAAGRPNNIVHDVNKLRIRNTGTQPLNISSIAVTSGWQLDSPPTLPLSIASGSYLDLAVRFIANPGGSSGVMLNGQLIINSDDGDEPVATVQLSGYWQPVSEGQKEPPLQTIANVFGYGTAITYPGQALNQGGKVVRVGDEVLSGYWKRVDSTLPVSMRQISAFHSQGFGATFYWYNKGSTSKSQLFTMDGDEGQSLLPHGNNGVNGSTSTFYSQGTFNPTGSFGLNLDGEWSDDTKNPQEQTGGGWGHHVRFFVARDRDGNIIPNTYIATMDYSGINYDYNDNTFILSNVKPESGPSAPTALTAIPSGSGIQLDWANNTEANLAGYNVYRGTSVTGPWMKLNVAVLISSDFNDVAAPVGVESFYQVMAVDNAGNESAPAAISATRAMDNTPPAPPTALVASGSQSGISLDWANNTEADLAGYNVYRSSSATGPFTLLNIGAPLSMSSYFDTTAPSGQISYYQVTAVDNSGNESTPASAQATRSVSDTTPPAAPTGLTASGTNLGNSLDWANNTEADLAGYEVWRSPTQSGTYLKVNVGLVSGSQYLDTSAPAGATSWYKVKAVDQSGNPSSFSNAASAARPADNTPPAAPSNLVLTPTGSGIALDWADNAEPDLGGYNVYRSDTDSGPWTKLNTTGLLTTSAFNDTTAPFDVTSYYQVTAADTATNESLPATGNAIRSSAAPAYTSQDIGNPLPAGSTTVITEAVDYDIAAGGTDIYGTSDSFRFAYQQLTGDFDYKVRLNSLTNTDPFAKAGLMARATLDANSQHAFIAATPGSNGHRFMYRSATGGSTTSGGTGAVNYPNEWLRLVRAGNVFTGYRSTDGTNWTQVGTVTLALPSQIYFGMAAVSKVSTATTTAQFRGLASNSTPVDLPPAAPSNLVATPSTDNISLDWSDNTETDLAGYNVYRSSSASGPWTKLNTSGLLTSSAYVDSAAPVGVISYFRVTAVDVGAHESNPATANATRPDPDPPPAAPANLVATGSTDNISLDWSDNVETDLAGYNVYRSGSASGPWTKLNTSGLLTTSAYVDSAAPVGVVSYYQVTAVDAAAHESTAATANAMRPSSIDTTPPAAPAGLTTATAKTGVTLSWTANTESDLAGYNVYRATSASGPWTNLNTAALITTTSYVDTAAAPNVTNYYRVTAVDTSTNESLPTATSAPGPDTIAPATPATLTSSHTSTTIILDWADNTETDLAGYNVYRSTSATGTFTKLNASVLTASAFTDTGAPQGVTSYYRVSAIDKSGNESGFATTNNIRPYSYASVDIGGAAAGSTTTVTAGTAYDVAGAGDIGNSADKMRFVYRAISGDFDIKVRVAGLTTANGAEKAALMARESLDAGAREVYAMTYSGTKGQRMGYRSTANAAVVGTGTAARAFPNVWLRLKRAGNVFTTYTSADGVNWTTLGSVTITMPTTMYVGMAASSFSSTSTATAQFRNLSP